MEGKVRNFKLFEGLSAETSGGLLLVVNENDVEEALEKTQGYLIGSVSDA